VSRRVWEGQSLTKDTDRKAIPLLTSHYFDMEKS
jgi:hypothetical protein